jgi:hypothetical protein
MLGLLTSYVPIVIMSAAAIALYWAVQLLAARTKLHE